MESIMLLIIAMILFATLMLIIDIIGYTIIRLIGLAHEVIGMIKNKRYE